MSPSVSFANVTWCTPDGDPLFTDLTLALTGCRTGLVGRNGVGKSTLLKLITGELRPHAGKVIVHGRVASLEQVVQEIEGRTVAALFGACEGLALLRRAEEGTAELDELGEEDWTLEARILAALGKVGLDASPDTLLQELSGGQRMRARIAAVWFAEPDLLLLDEPTNNLDCEGREAVLSLLKEWSRGAIVISHDRELLESMDAIVELTSLGARKYGGNWSHYRERKAQELEAAQHVLAHAQKRLTEVDRDAQVAVERKARRDAAGWRKRAKGGEPPILLGARKDRAEDSGGVGARLAERRRSAAAERLVSARGRLEVIQPFTVVLAPTGLPAGKTVLEVSHVTAGYEPGQPIVREVSFSITGPERVAIQGRNGSGKTTLLQVITGKLAPWAGSVRLAVPYAMLDQQVSLLIPQLSIRDNYRKLNPHGDENACRSSLARFRFRADAALQTVATLSGGQLLRAGLACVLGGSHPPSLLILDEPTNSLDMESIETVEAGLRGYDGALLVVSHDGAFLQEVGITRWLILPSGRLEARRFSEIPETR